MIKKIVIILLVVMLSSFISSCDDNNKKYFYSLEDKEKFLEETKLEEFTQHDIIPVYYKICGFICLPKENTIAYFVPVYFVSNAEEFNSIRKYPDRRYIITNDIDLSPVDNFQPIGTKEKPFSGEISSRFIKEIEQFDYRNDYSPGKDLYVSSDSYFYRDFNETMYTVKNANININDDNYTEYVGVFGYITGEIHDLAFHNVNININSALPTYAGIVGGYSDSIIGANVLVNQSIITGNYAVGGVYGGVSLSKLNFSSKELGMNNVVKIKPVSDKSYIGGYVGIFNVIGNWILDQGEYVVNSNVDFSIIDNDVSGEIKIGGIYGKVNSFSDYNYNITEPNQYYAQFKIYGTLKSSIEGENYNFGSFIGELSLNTNDSLENVDIDVDIQMHTFVNQDFQYVYTIVNESEENIVFINKSTGNLVDDYLKLRNTSNYVGYFIEEYNENYFGFYLYDLLAIIGAEYDESNLIKQENKN